METKGRSPKVSVGSDNDVYEDEERDDIHFEPIIPLPDKIKVQERQRLSSSTQYYRIPLGSFKSCKVLILFQVRPRLFESF